MQVLHDNAGPHANVVALTPEEGKALAAKLSADIDLMAILTTAAASALPAVQDALDMLTTLVALSSQDQYLEARQGIAMCNANLIIIHRRIFALRPDQIRGRVEKVIAERNPHHLHALERFMVATDDFWPKANP